MRCQLHRFLHKKEDNTRHPINYCTSIRQDNHTACAENYRMKIIMYIIFYFICTNFWKYFVYFGFNTAVYYVMMKMISLKTINVISLDHYYSRSKSLMVLYFTNKIR